jgi:hypothetical protein
MEPRKDAEGRAIIGLRDLSFSHVPHLSATPPSLLTFDRSPSPQRAAIFTDAQLDDVVFDSTPFKIAWLLEPLELLEITYKAVGLHGFDKYFDLVLTHDEEYLRLKPEFVFMPFGGCWVHPNDWRVYPKTKNVSIVASGKKLLKGHLLRHDVVSRFGAQLDGVFGLAYQAIDEKLDGLRDFRYSIVIESSRRNYFFTEKLIDAFMTGTVPIFWGCPDIAKFFNPDGMIQFEHADELEGILSQLSAQDYERRLPAIQQNFERAKTFAVPEDYMYSYILEPRGIV